MSCKLVRLLLAVVVVVLHGREDWCVNGEVDISTQLPCEGVEFPLEK